MSVRQINALEIKDEDGAKQIKESDPSDGAPNQFGGGRP